MIIKGSSSRLGCDFFTADLPKVWHWPNDNESAQVLNLQFWTVLVFVWEKTGFPWRRVSQAMMFTVDVKF